MKHPHKFVTEKEVHELFDLEKFDPIGTLPYDTVLILEGDITLDGDLTLNSLEEMIFGGNRETEEELIIVKGNLIVKGDLNLGEDYPNIIVMGDLHCDVLHSKDDLIHVTGDAYIKYAFNGNYNHGQIIVEGITHVPYLLNSDHCSNINPPDSTIIINYYSDHADSFDYDYYRSDLENVLTPEALYKGSFDTGTFIEAVRTGKSLFREGAKTKKELLIEEIKAMAQNSTLIKETTSLDLSKKHLDYLPPAIGKLTELETLNLGNNPFKIVPEEIGNLSKLKELNLQASRITNLPDSIGQLSQLEVFKLGFCNKLEALPETFGNLTNLKKLVLCSFKINIPTSFTNLTNLEEIQMLDYFNSKDREEVTNFPDWVFELKGLKRFQFNRGNISKKDIKKFRTLNPDTKTIF